MTLYGILDTGVGLVTHANAAGDSVARMPGITGDVPDGHEVPMPYGAGFGICWRTADKAINTTVIAAPSINRYENAPPVVITAAPAKPLVIAPIRPKASAEAVPVARTLVG